MRDFTPQIGRWTTRSIPLSGGRLAAKNMYCTI